MKRNFVLFFQFLAAVAITGSPAWAQSSAGHALAQKFAVEEKGAPQQAKPQPKKIAETKPAQRAPAPGQDYEREMLEAAKAEAAQRQAAEQDNSKGAAAPATAPAAAPAQTPAQAAQQPPTAPAASVSKTAKPPETEIKAQADAPAAAPAARQADDSRASILLVLNQTGSGEIPKTFDPIICLGDVCYVSGGNAAASKPLARQDALSPKSSMTTGAGACADTPACAFRGVAIPEGVDLQIVDLGIVRHEERERVPAKIDRTCTVEDGFLACDKPATAPDYRLWIVPEAVAEKAGGERIEAALDAELPEENVTLETDK